MTFLTILVASFIGGALGQVLVLYIVGGLANRAEANKVKIIHEALAEYQEAMSKEQARMEKYAKMEG